MTKPEELARQEIDRQLEECGWIVESRNEINLSGQRVAIRKFRLEEGHGFVDYLLFVSGQPVGVLEAKPVGYPLGSMDVFGTWTTSDRSRRDALARLQVIEYMP